MADKEVPEGYEERFLRCRTFGHNWRVSEKIPEPGNIYQFTLVCRDCRSKRTDRIHTRTGIPKGRRYDYTPGYLVDETKGLRRTTYRLEFIRRAP